MDWEDEKRFQRRRKEELTLFFPLTVHLLTSLDRHVSFWNTGRGTTEWICCDTLCWWHINRSTSHIWLWGESVRLQVRCMKLVFNAHQVTATWIRNVVLLMKSWIIRDSQLELVCLLFNSQIKTIMKRQSSFDCILLTDGWQVPRSGHDNRLQDNWAFSICSWTSVADMIRNEFIYVTLRWNSDFGSV